MYWYIMLYYKSLRLANGKPKWAVKDENYYIIQNPTKDQIESAIDEKYRPKKCCICGDTKTYVNNSGTSQWCSHKCDKDNCTGYLCRKCYDMYDVDSPNNLRKSTANCRTGNTSKGSPQGRSIIYQAVIVKVHDIVDLNIKNNNFGCHIDMEHPVYGKIDAKGSKLKNGRYSFSIRKKIYCDTYFCMGFDEYWNSVESMYIIPNDDWIASLKDLSITKDPSKSTKYNCDQYKIDNIEPYNREYHYIMRYFQDREYFGIEDVKKWLKLKV